MSTEMNLKFWRGGSAAAERLAANVLHLDGFSSVDPQCPLGGPDGLKDVVCEKNGWSYVGAAYFPGSEKKFKDIRDKFVHDLEGVARNKSQGIVFVTNQPISPTERADLTKLASKDSAKAIIYHLERIRLLLDSPSGYGLRLEYLDIDMSREEQLSFFSQWNSSFSELLREHGMMIVDELSKKIDSLKDPTNNLERRVHELVEATRAVGLEIINKSEKSELSTASDGPASSALTLEGLCMLHRALLFDHPNPETIGRFREVPVWIGGVDSTPETASYVPPDPENVVPLTQNVLDDWHQTYERLLSTTDIAEKIQGITKFHAGLLEIHPFLDGNGRIARFLLMQQARELLEHDARIILEDRKPYFDSLVLAQQGDLSALESILTQAIFGVESLSSTS